MSLVWCHASFGLDGIIGLARVESKPEVVGSSHPPLIMYQGLTDTFAIPCSWLRHAWPCRRLP